MRPASDAAAAEGPAGVSDLIGPAAQQVPTGQGPAAVRVFPAAATPGRGTLFVGHGAGGQRDAADVRALTGLADDGWTVVLVDQPWRVAGRKIATAPPTLDRAWSEVLTSLAEDGHAPDGTDLPRPWVYAGRSAGARVACRTSVGDTAPAPLAVVALAFPLHPPGKPERSRAEELATPLRAGIPTLVVQGGRDPMGTPAQLREAIRDVIGDVIGDACEEPSREQLTLHEVPGTHSPTRDLAALQGHVRAWLARVVADTPAHDAPPGSDADAPPGSVASVGRTPSTGAQPQ